MGDAARRDNSYHFTKGSLITARTRGGLSVAAENVLIETVDLDSSGVRQIGPKVRTTALLQDRRGEVQEAVREASTIARDAVAEVAEKDGWRVGSLEVKFALTIAAEAGVIVSRASAEASFEITVTIDRRTKQENA
jgi:Trypsin-co-occurring domain 1